MFPKLCLSSLIVLSATLFFACKKRGFSDESQTSDTSPAAQAAAAATADAYQGGVLGDPRADARNSNSARLINEIGMQPIADRALIADNALNTARTYLRMRYSLRLERVMNGPEAIEPRFSPVPAAEPGGLAAEQVELRLNLNTPQGSADAPRPLTVTFRTEIFSRMAGFSQERLAALGEQSYIDLVREMVTAIDKALARMVAVETASGTLSNYIPAELVGTYQTTLTELHIQVLAEAATLRAGALSANWLQTPDGAEILRVGRALDPGFEARITNAEISRRTAARNAELRAKGEPVVTEKAVLMDELRRWQSDVQRVDPNATQRLSATARILDVARRVTGSR